VVVGESVGAADGRSVVGVLEGPSEGCADGACVGSLVAGEAVGSVVGAADGSATVCPFELPVLLKIQATQATERDDLNHIMASLAVLERPQPQQPQGSSQICPTVGVSKIDATVCVTLEVADSDSHAHKHAIISGCS